MPRGLKKNTKGIGRVIVSPKAKKISPIEKTVLPKIVKLVPRKNSSIFSKGKQRKTQDNLTKSRNYKANLYRLARVLGVFFIIASLLSGIFVYTKSGDYNYALKDSIVN